MERSDFKHILNEWNNMEFALTKMDYPEFSMAGPASLLQFIQPGYNRPLLWALSALTQSVSHRWRSVTADLHRSIRWSKHGDVELPVEV